MFLPLWLKCRRSSMCPPCDIAWFAMTQCVLRPIRSHAKSLVGLFHPCVEMAHRVQGSLHFLISLYKAGVVQTTGVSIPGSRRICLRVGIPHLNLRIFVVVSLRALTYNWFEGPYVQLPARFLCPNWSSRWQNCCAVRWVGLRSSHRSLCNVHGSSSGTDYLQGFVLRCILQRITNSLPRAAAGSCAATWCFS